MKSHLDSGELEDAYNNIAQLKKILLKKTFQYRPNPALAIGFSNPTPVTGIVAYSTNRSLEAIAEQAKRLNTTQDIALMPDFIAIIGQGIIGNRKPLRGECNQYKLAENSQELVELRKTGRHTLLRLYMQILRNLIQSHYSH